MSLVCAVHCATVWMNRHLSTHLFGCFLPRHFQNSTIAKKCSLYLFVSWLKRLSPSVVPLFTKSTIFFGLTLSWTSFRAVRCWRAYLCPLPSVNDILVMHCLAGGSGVALLNSSLCLEEESNTGLSECWRLHKRGCVIKTRINMSMSSNSQRNI